MDTKLTLKLDREIIEEAKKYAREKKSACQSSLSHIWKNWRAPACRNPLPHW